MRGIRSFTAHILRRVDRFLSLPLGEAMGERIREHKFSEMTYES